MPESENSSLDELLKKWNKAKANRAVYLKRATRRTAFSTIPLAAGFVLLLFLGRDILYSSELSLLFLGLALLPIFSFAMGIFGGTALANESQLYREIVKYEEDKRILPIVLPGLLEDGLSISTATLLKLIQQIDESDAEMLRDNQRELWGFVRQDFYPTGGTTHKEMRELKFAAVAALGKVGAYNVLGDVERFAVRLAQENTDAPLLEAIEEVLPAIRQRTAEAMTAQTLLRASDAKRDDSTLLRGASSSNTTQKEQLLRANVQDNPPEL